MRPTRGAADVQAVLPFSPDPRKHSYVTFSTAVLALLKRRDVSSVLDETPEEEIVHCRVR